MQIQAGLYLEKLPREIKKKRQSTGFGLSENKYSWNPCAKGFQLLYFYGGYVHPDVLYAEKQIFCKTKEEKFFGTLLFCMLK